MKTLIYFDYAATTPVDPRVAQKMLQCLTTDEAFGNASSSHVYGQAAHQAIENARQQVANLIHANTNEIVWTSGATEADNLALKGVANLYQKKGKHMVTVKTEHPAVLDCCQQLEKQGFEITYLAPEKNGLVNLNQLEAALRDDTILVSVMHVNNEIGVIQDLAAIGKLTYARGILFHVDAAQSVGKIPINVNEMHIDLMAFSAHKMYGPKGIGVLYVRKKPRVRVAAQIHGGGQEQGMRSGTLATHQIVGMGEACFLASQQMQADHENLCELRNYFLQQLSAFKNVSLNSDPAHCIPGIINVCFAGIKSQDLMKSLPELAISAGSACHAKGIEPSYVLRALELSYDVALSSVRFSFGRYTTRAEVEYAIGCLRRDR